MQQNLVRKQMKLNRNMIAKQRKRPKKGSVSRREVNRIVTRKINKMDELHNHHKDSTVAVTSAGHFYDLTDIPLGDKDIERSGDEIRYHTLSLKYWFNKADDVNAPTNLIRAIIFLWKGEDSINAPTLDKLLFKNTSSRDKFGSFSLDYVQQYDILRDNIYTLSRDQEMITDNIYINKGLHNRVCKYKADGSLNGTYKVYCCFLSDDPVSTYAPGVNFVSDLKFRG